MKRTYVRPTMVGERFVANEYVAACGDKNKVYKFQCDAQKWTGLTVRQCGLTDRMDSRKQVMMYG